MNRLYAIATSSRYLLPQGFGMVLKRSLLLTLLLAGAVQAAGMGADDARLLLNRAGFGATLDLVKT